MTRYIEPPAHLNSKPARSVLMENSVAVDKSEFGQRILKKQ